MRVTPPCSRPTHSAPAERFPHTPPPAWSCLGTLCQTQTPSPLPPPLKTWLLLCFRQRCHWHSRLREGQSPGLCHVVWREMRVRFRRRPMASREQIRECFLKIIRQMRALILNDKFQNKNTNANVSNSNTTTTTQSCNEIWLPLSSCTMLCSLRRSIASARACSSRSLITASRAAMVDCSCARVRPQVT